MPRRQAFLGPGQPRAASVSGEGAGTGAAPMPSSGGRVGVRPASPMGGVQGTAGMDPTIANQLQSILGGPGEGAGPGMGGPPPEMTAGGPMAPLNIQPMLQPAKTDPMMQQQQQGGPGGGPGGAMPISRAPLQPWGSSMPAASPMPDQPNASMMPAGYDQGGSGGDPTGLGDQADPNQPAPVPMMLLKLLKAMGV